MSKLASIAKLILWGIRLILPWIGHVVVFTLHLVLITMASLWVGVPTACRTIADNWTTRAIDGGFPTLYATHLYNVLCVIAFIVILFSWVVFSYITVYIIRYIF